MSLKFFHIVFIVLSITVAFGFGWWTVVSAPKTPVYFFMGVFSWVIGAGLVVYGVKFLRKFRSLGMVTLAGISVSLWVLLTMDSAIACSTCFSNVEGAGSLQIQGVRQGIYFLMGLTGFMLTAFSVFFLNLWRKSKRFAT